MGKYDKVDRSYFANKDRYAELISVGIYHKRYHVKGEELHTEETAYPSMTKNSVKERDLLVSMVDSKVKYGMEIENYSDYSMPRRFLSYEACDYEKQAQELEYRHKVKQDLKSFTERKSKMKAGDYYVPVINMLLFLGVGHWKGHSTMKDMFQVPEEYKPYIQDKLLNYSFPIIEADYVNYMDFQTDLRQFFQIMQCRSDKQKLKELLKQEEFQSLCMDAQKAIAVHLDDETLIHHVVEEEKDMCKALRDWAKEEREEGKLEGQREGRIEGKREGRKETLTESIRAIMENFQLSLEQAMDALNVRQDQREEYRKLLE